MQNQIIALIDLDGTISECHDALIESLNELKSPFENINTEFDDNLPQYIEARRKIIMRVPGFWKNLKPLQSGIELVNLFQKLNISAYVLTKGPNDSSIAWSEKFEWCRIHIPDLKVIITEDKSIVFGDILVDDWPPYIFEWSKRFPNGFIIIPDNPWNIQYDFTKLKNFIRYNGVNLLEIKYALQLFFKDILH